MNDEKVISKYSEQKQPSRGVLRKRYSENMQQIYRTTTCRSVISIQLLCNFIEIKLRHVCSPINLLHIFRTPFLMNTSGRPLLSEAVSYSHNVCSEKFYKFPEEKPKAVAQRYSVKKMFLEISQN